MRWFRSKALDPEQAPEEAAAQTEQVITTEEPAEGQGSEPTKPRRRGTRGGKGRAKAATDAARTEEPAPSAKRGARSRASADEEPKPARARRRTATPRRSALPTVRKEMLISHDAGEQRVAILEDSTAVEVYLGRPGRRSIAGNVYKGVVDNILPGMEASFVDIGLEKNGFLYVDEIVVPELEGKRHGKRIQDLIKRGEQVLVQAVKDPMGTKGARLTTEISLPGRFVVYVPYGDGIGVSRRLDDDERERLKVICKTLELPEGGIIVRTAAEGATEQELAGDLAFLRKLWGTIQSRAARSAAPSLVYREAELPLRVVRDLFLRDFERLAVDHERTYRRIVSYLKRTSPELARKVEWYRDAEPLMERAGVDAAVRSTLHRRVDLPSGGYLIFDYAEAFTVIDVNTGRFVGARGKASGARLEETITKNNLEAAKEIVRQLRLRDIGGIIVIDFIDMANPKNRQEVEEALKSELERDRTKTYVVEISPLGLVEMTRQNVTEGPREILTARCPVCSGDGIVVSDETYAVEAERLLRRTARSSSAEALLVELQSHVAGILIGPAGARLAEIEKETGKRFAFETRDDLPPDHLVVLAEGSAEEIEPRALPVAAGQELELRLEAAHARHPEDAIARLDGYVIAVADGAGRVGQEVRVRIERATRTVAYASLASVAEVEMPVDPGALAEAEDDAPAPRPARTATRGGRSRAPRAKKPAPEERAGEAPPATAEAAQPDVAEVGDDAAEDEKPKPRARRGTRGGRGRARKAPEPAADAASGEPAAEAARNEARRASAVAGQPAKPADQARTEPDVSAQDEPAAAEEKPKRKTRRGTRGGRGRKRPAAATGNGVAEPIPGTNPEEAAESDAATPEGSDDGANGDAPAPKKRTRRGSRGGRGRRKPAAVATEPVATEEPGG